MEDVSPSVDRIVEALLASPDVEAAILFGSRVRQSDDSPADAGSDVDIQVVVKRPTQWIQRAWAESVLSAEMIEAWNVRNAFGGVKKVSVLLSDSELDLVFVPARRMRWARWGLAWGVHRISRQGMRQAGDLRLLADRGYRLLKGGPRWESFWQRVVAEVTIPGLSDEEVRNLAAGAQIDFRSIQRKLERGELRAAQRWLHTGMAETNFKLMHELRRRRSQRSFHDARRVEALLDPDSLARVTVSATLSAQAIEAAAKLSAQTTRYLLTELVGDE